MYRNVVYNVRDGQGVITLFTWDEAGNRVHVDVPHNSTIYYEDTRGKHKSLFGDPLAMKTFRNNGDRRRWQESHSEFRAFGSFSPVREFLLTHFNDKFEDPTFAQYPLRVCFLDIEIEVGDTFPKPDTADYPINCITVYDSLTEEYHTFVMDPQMRKFEKIPSIMHVFATEEEMLLEFLTWFRHNCPDILSGWNLEGFDIPYIVNRIKRTLPGQEVMLSPLADVSKYTRNQRGHPESVSTYKIEGVTVLDYFFLYKYKFGKASAQSFKLDAIAMDVLGEGKVDYEGTISEFQKNDFEGFVGYNVVDVQLLVKMDKRLKFIELARTICNMGLCEYGAIFNSMPYILGSLALEGMKQGLILPSDPPSGSRDSDTSFTGALVFDIQPGVYRGGVATFDLNSLYPNIIISCNISPETKIAKIIEDLGGNVRLKDRFGKEKIVERSAYEKLIKGLVKSSNNVLYTNPSLKKGLLPLWLEKAYATRKKMRIEAKRLEKLSIQAKDEGDEKESIRLEIEAKRADLFQLGFKIMLNSAYGQLGSKHFPLFDLDNAEAVTISGQHIIKNSADFLNKVFKVKFNADKNIILGGDTDGLCVNMEALVKTVFGGELPDKWSKEKIHQACVIIDKVTDVLNVNCQKIVERDFNSPVQTIEFKREAFCTEAAYLAKKHYVLHVRDSEGTPVDFFKYTGVEVKKNEFSKVVKKILSEVIEKSMIDNWGREEFSKRGLEIWEKFAKMKPDQIAITKGIGTDKLIPAGFMIAAKGVPGHAKAALFHNQLIEKLDLKKKYDNLKLGDKVKFVYVKNNQFDIDAIGWKDKWPKEFSEYFEVDYQTMFEKMILSPLETFAEINKWSKIDVRNTSEVDVLDI